MANESFLACDFAVCTFPPCPLLPSLLTLCLCCCRCLKWTAFCFLLVFLVCCHFRRTFCKPYILCSFFLLILLILLRICCFIYVLTALQKLVFFFVGSRYVCLIYTKNFKPERIELKVEVGVKCQHNGSFQALRQLHNTHIHTQAHLKVFARFEDGPRPQIR